MWRHRRARNSTFMSIRSPKYPHLETCTDVALVLGRCRPASMFTSSAGSLQGMSSPAVGRQVNWVKEEMCWAAVANLAA